MFQSTPPRGGRPPAGCGHPSHQPVSIHAPARGATPTGTNLSQSRAVSIHAPARGATSIRTDAATGGRSFNPRLREGGDSVAQASVHRAYRFQSTPPRGGRRARSSQRLASVDVSIHAPARGATTTVRVFGSTVIVSIHAPARGATCNRFRWGCGWCRFQSTPPRGGRQPSASSLPMLPKFQSTPPRGGRR